MNTGTYRIEMDVPRSGTGDPGLLRFHLRRIQADNNLKQIGANGQPVGVGIEWHTHREVTLARCITILRLFVRHLKSVGIIAQGCEPTVMESKLVPAGKDLPYLDFSLRWTP